MTENDTAGSKSKGRKPERERRELSFCLCITNRSCGDYTGSPNLLASTTQGPTSYHHVHLEGPRCEAIRNYCNGLQVIKKPTSRNSNLFNLICNCDLFWETTSCLVQSLEKGRKKNKKLKISQNQQSNNMSGGHSLQRTKNPEQERVTGQEGRDE